MINQIESVCLEDDGLHYGTEKLPMIDVTRCDVPYYSSFIELKLFFAQESNVVFDQ